MTSQTDRHRRRMGTQWTYCGRDYSADGLLTADRRVTTTCVDCLSVNGRPRDPRIAYALRVVAELTEAGQQARALVAGGEAEDTYVTDERHRPDPDQVVGIELADGDAALLLLDGTERERTGDNRWSMAAWDDEVDVRQVPVEDLLGVLLDDS